MKARSLGRVLASIFPRWLDGPFRMDVIDLQGGSLDGTLSEYVCLPQQALCAVPAHLTHEEAARCRAPGSRPGTRSARRAPWVRTKPC